MKKLIAIFIIVSMILILAACRDEQDNVINPNEDIHTDSDNEQENVSEQENINYMDDIINLSKTMNKAVMTNIVTELTVEQQKELHELLHIEKWVEYEPEGRGASLDFIIRNDNEAEMIFFDGNGVIIADPEKDERIYCTVPKVIVEQLKMFGLKVRDEGIKNGNEHLTKQINEFNSLIIGEPDQLYEIEEKYIYTLSEEDLKELHSLLKIEKWKVYEGSNKSVYSDEDIPLTLHKYLYGYDMLLQIKQYDDLYIAKSHSYEGPTDQDYIFEIPEEIYLNLINFKKILEKDR